MLDLPALLAQIKQEPAWHTSDRNALTVFKTGTLRIVLLALHAGVLHRVVAVEEAVFLLTLAVSK